MAQTQMSDPAQDAIKKALQSGQLDQAQKLVLQAREAAPKNVQWQFMEGVIQAQQGQTDKAIDTFKKITEAHPDLSEAFNNLGVLYAAKGRLEESRAYLEKALQTHPSYAAAHRNLSDVLSQLAKDSYGKALQVDPKVKSSPPQVTLLGSIGPEKRSQAASSPVAAKTPPTTTVAVASTPTTASAVPAAKTSAPTPAPASSAPAPSKTQTPGTPPVVNSSASPTAKPASQTPASASASASGSMTQASASTPAEKKPLVPEAAQPKAQAPTANKVVPAANKAEEAAIQSAIAIWAKAWSQKDMPRYLSAYADNFVPSEKMSRAKWESDRRLRIVSKKSISVGVSQVQITLQGQKATVRFQQIYESDNFKGNSRKTLEMSKQGPRWLIVRETVN